MIFRRKCFFGAQDISLGVFCGAVGVALPIVLFGGSFLRIAKRPYKIAVLGNIFHRPGS